MTDAISAPAAKPAPNADPQQAEKLREGFDLAGFQDALRHGGRNSTSVDYPWSPRETRHGDVSKPNLA